MRKGWLYWLRSALPRCLCLLIASSIILLSTSIESNASVVAGTSKSVSVTYNASDEACWRGNTYLPWNYVHDFNEWHYDENMSYFWYKGKNVKLFDSEAQYYGYQIKVTRTSNTACTFTSADQNFWAIGTAGQLMNGENRGGIVTSPSFTAWVPTDNSIQAVHMAPFFHMYSYEDYLFHGSDDDDPTYDSYCGTYNINCKYTVTYTGYETKAEYTTAMSNIQTELENQTTELETQTEELQNQTAELEEQTETQKGILASVQDFFGSFFQNLIDSVVGLFVPNSEEMSDLLGQFDDFFSETFGFLYYPFEVLTRFVDLVLNSDGTTRFTFPSFSIMGFKVWDNIAFDFYNYGIVNELFIYVRRGTGVIIVFAFINYLRNFFDKRFGGGGK